MAKIPPGVARIVLAVVVPSVLLLLGGYVGLQVIPTYVRLLKATAWHRLPPPPDKPISIAAIGAYCIAVEVTGGELYSTCDDPFAGAVEWELGVPPFLAGGGSPSPCHERTLPEPPDNPIAIVEDCWGTETTAISKFALYDDRGIWSYQYVSPGIGFLLMGSLASTLLGGLAGLLLGVRVVVLAARKAPVQAT